MFRSKLIVLSVFHRYLNLVIRSLFQLCTLRCDRFVCHFPKESIDPWPFNCQALARTSLPSTAPHLKLKLIWFAFMFDSSHWTGLIDWYTRDSWLRVEFMGETTSHSHVGDAPQIPIIASNWMGRDNQIYKIRFFHLLFNSVLLFIVFSLIVYRFRSNQIKSATFWLHFLPSSLHISIQNHIKSNIPKSKKSRKSKTTKKITKNKKEKENSKRSNINQFTFHSHKRISNQNITSTSAIRPTPPPALTPSFLRCLFPNFPIASLFHRFYPFFSLDFLFVNSHYLYHFLSINFTANANIADSVLNCIDFC